MDVWVAYIRNTEVSDIHESMILVGAFASYDAAFDAVKARLNEMEPDGEFSYEKINKDGESYL